MNSTIFRDSHKPTESWWAKPLTRDQWTAEHQKQVAERMLLSNPPIPTAKDGPTSIQEVRRQRVPSTL